VPTFVDRAIVSVLPLIPRPLVKRVSSPYIAGKTLEDACRVVAGLNRRGRSATIDVLGEEITHSDEARAIARTYTDVLEAIDRGRLDANISVKLTALGLELGYEQCLANVEAVARAAAKRSTFVRIDMEDARFTDRTLRVFRELRGGGFDNVGVALQARLRRTLDDVRALADLRPNVRVCKGIYLEHEEIAFQEPGEVRRAFVRVVEALVDARSYVALATHDEQLIEESCRVVREAGLAPCDYEFQFLLGVRPDRADRLIGEGHRLRVYVPFGVRWYEYSVRRLKENPSIAGTIASATFARMLGRRS
jgi:proline dehydrogenase